MWIFFCQKKGIWFFSIENERKLIFFWNEVLFWSEGLNTVPINDGRKSLFAEISDDVVDEESNMDGRAGRIFVLLASNREYWLIVVPYFQEPGHFWKISELVALDPKWNLQFFEGLVKIAEVAVVPFVGAEFKRKMQIVPLLLLEVQNHGER